MEQRQFLAIVLAVILFGISVAMGVNVVIEGIDANARHQMSKSQEVSLNFENNLVTWNTFPHMQM
ncbi:hypothetical protein KQI52_06755 [bacterium]|nr:hypothetical protein [bacterium]